MVAFFGPRKRVRTSVVVPSRPPDLELKLLTMAVPLLQPDISKENVTSEKKSEQVRVPMTFSLPSSTLRETMFGLLVPEVPVPTLEEVPLCSATGVP